MTRLAVLRQRLGIAPALPELNSILERRPI